MSFDNKIYYLGVLCSRKHEYLQTKQSLRYISSNGCVECVKLMRKEHNIRNKEKQSTIFIEKKDITFDINKFFVGTLCYKKHKFKNYEGSLRDKISGTCRECFKENEYYKHNRNKVLEKIKIRNQIPEIKEKRKEYLKNYYSILINKEKKKITDKNYRDNIQDKKERNLYQKKWQKKKRNENLSFKISTLITARLNHCLKKGKQNNSWKNLVNFNIDQLKKHLKIKTQDNLKNKEIDHIILLSWFSFQTFTDYDFKIAWSLKNLQLLTKKENTIKRNYYAGSPQKRILNLEEFKKLKKLFPLKLLCNCIWKEYENSI